MHRSFAAMHISICIGALLLCILSTYGSASKVPLTVASPADQLARILGAVDSSGPLLHSVYVVLHEGLGHDTQVLQACSWIASNHVVAGVLHPLADPQQFERMLSSVLGSNCACIVTEHACMHKRSLHRVQQSNTLVETPQMMMMSCR